MQISGKKKNIRQHEMDEDEKEDWKKRIGRVEYLSKKRLGLEVGKTEIGVHVCVLRGMKKTPEGAYVKEYVNPAQEDLVPLQMVVTRVASPDPRYIERPPPSVKEEFPVNSRAFFLGSAYYGTLATVTGHSGHDTIDISMIVPTEMRSAIEPSFGRQITKKQLDMVQYTPSYAVANELNLDPLVLSKLTSSLTVQDKGLQRINLGLNLKFEAKQLKVVGYTRKSRNGQWEFSNRAVDLIKAYIDAFPQFIQLLHSKAKGSRKCDIRYATQERLMMIIFSHAACSRHGMD